MSDDYGIIGSISHGIREAKAQRVSDAQAKAIINALDDEPSPGEPDTTTRTLQAMNTSLDLIELEAEKIRDRISAMQETVREIRDDLPNFPGYSTPEQAITRRRAIRLIRDLYAMYRDPEPDTF